MNAMETYRQWLDLFADDEATVSELKSIENNPAEIEDRFYRELEFGTAGMRGVIGMGTNRINVHNVRRVTRALAKYILTTENGAEKGVAIAYDSRNYSDVFAKQAALVLCAAGIRTYLFDSLRPVPVLSFTIRHLGCISGIVITASHNPKEYNGYKAYWTDGGQMTPESVKGITDRLPETSYAEARPMEEKEALEKGLLTYIGKEVDDAYIAAVKKLSVNPELAREMGKTLKIVYTPLHGSGNLPVRGTLPANAAAVTTIVSTDMARAIAQSFGCEMIEVLTGFKYIAEQIHLFETTGSHTFQFGFEESFGYLSGTDVRDKDGVNACMLIAEAAAWYKKTYNCTLVDAIDRLYEEYGYYGDKVTSFVLPGKDGLAKIQEVMTGLRENPPAEFGGVKVTALRDYLKSLRTQGGRTEQLTLPKSNVLYFEMEGGAWLCVRPSGTEPKIKLYVNAVTASAEETRRQLDKISDAAVKLLESL